MLEDTNSLDGAQIFSIKIPVGLSSKTVFVFGAFGGGAPTDICTQETQSAKISLNSIDKINPEYNLSNSRNCCDVRI